MNELDYARSLWLGVIQGCTEFLPISSSGHLAITQRLLGMDPDSPTLLLFDVITHLATLIAVVYVFRSHARSFISRLIRESSSSWSGRRFAWPVVVLVIVATIPTAIIGLSFKDTFENSFDRPQWIGMGLIITGFLLLMWRLVGRGQRGWRRFSKWQALLVGIAQGCAIMPGISRSGATICVASYCGLRHRWAAQFSFLLAIPAILGGVVLKLRDTFNLTGQELEQIPWGPIVTGSLASLVVGIVALQLLLHLIRRAKLHYFAFYCWGAGAVVIWMG